jgi:hypothetical protein
VRDVHVRLSGGPCGGSTVSINRRWEDQVTTQSRRPTPGAAPDLLTVVEAGRVLRIGRTKADELVRRWFRTDGADGLPAVRIDGQVRVLRHGVEQLVGGPITWPIPDEPVETATPPLATAIDLRDHG